MIASILLIESILGIIFYILYCIFKWEYAYNLCGGLNARIYLILVGITFAASISSILMKGS